MIIADYLNYSQSSLLKRIIISAPLFIISFALTQVDFTILWRYFSWANQTTAVIALWVGAMYLLIAKKNFWVAAIPAVFMTWNIFVYILSQKIGLGLDLNMSYVIGFVLTAIWIAYFIYQYRKMTDSVGQFELDHPIQTQQQIVS